MNPGIDPVREQYERWPYPPPRETHAGFARYAQKYEILRNLAWRFWPAGLPRPRLRVLSAGCGTMAAACYAWFYPEYEVVGIDVSRASLAEAEKLRVRYGLKNLTLQQLAIEEAGALGAEFDYISCHGVLHHTEDPAAALRALGGVLDREGVLRIALYGRYPRLQVYAFQELFRGLGLDQTPGSIAVAREILASLPPEHPLQSYLRGAVDHLTDAGLVDTWLHRRDRAYSVGDCLALVAEAGLVFQGWEMNLEYYPEGSPLLPPGLRARLEELPEEEIWKAMEIYAGTMRMHSFHVCRRDRPEAAYRIPWDEEALLTCVPGHCVDLVKTGEAEWAMGREPLPPVVLMAGEAAIFAKMDGTRTLRECLAAAGVTGDDAALLVAASPLMRLLWRTGYGVFCLPRG